MTDEPEQDPSDPGPTITPGRVRRRRGGRPPGGTGPGGEGYDVPITTRLTATQANDLYEAWRSSGQRVKFAVYVRAVLVERAARGE